MNDFILDLLHAVMTAAVPVITIYIVKLINSFRDKATASTENERMQWYYQEIADAISAAVSATNQTYVDSLKRAGAFTKEAQKEAAQRALDACLAALSPAVKEFLAGLYGDINEYLSTMIEAEVRGQKLATGE